MIESGEISVLMPPTFRLKVHHHQSGTSYKHFIICLKLTYLLYKKISEKPSGFPRGPSQLVFLTAWQTSWRRDSVLWHFVTSVMLSGHQCPYWHVPVTRQSQHATQERTSNAVRRLGKFSYRNQVFLQGYQFCCVGFNLFIQWPIKALCSCLKKFLDKTFIMFSHDID